MSGTSQQRWQPQELGGRLGRPLGSGRPALTADMDFSLHGEVVTAQLAIQLGTWLPSLRKLTDP